MIFVNFKIYKQSFGQGAVELAKICRRVSEKTKVEIIPVVAALNAAMIKKEVGGKVFLQEVGRQLEGPFTGQVSMEQAKSLGIDGALVNHSEAKRAQGTIKQIVANKPAGFEIILCVRSAGQVEKWAKDLAVDFVAYEPAYLIGSQDKSVATEKPEVIGRVAKMLDCPVLAGAGIKNKQDVEIALAMGAKGVLVASDIVKAEDPEKELLELSGAFSV